MENRKEARKRAAQKAAELVAQMTIEERAAQLRYDAPAGQKQNRPYQYGN